MVNKSVAPLISIKSLHLVCLQDMYDLRHLYLTDNNLDHIPLPLPENLRALHLQVGFWWGMPNCSMENRSTEEESGHRELLIMALWHTVTIFLPCLIHSLSQSWVQGIRTFLTLSILIDFQKLSTLFSNHNASFWNFLEKKIWKLPCLTKCVKIENGREKGREKNLISLLAFGGKNDNLCFYFRFDVLNSIQS